MALQWQVSDIFSEDMMVGEERNPLDAGCRLRGWDESSTSSGQAGDATSACDVQVVLHEVT